MKNKAVFCLVTTFFLFSGLLIGQEEVWQKLELPQKTLEYKLDRALLNQLSFKILGIAYAKTKGISPEDFAAYGLKCWGSWWKDKDYSYYVTKMNNVFSTDKDFIMEISSETEDKIDLKMNIFGKNQIASLAESGVTKEEYIRYFETLMTSMAGYMGFEHKYKLEDDYIYLTIVKNKTAEKWQKLVLPQKTLDYKLNRALVNQAGDIVHGIAYAKTKGTSPEDFAAYGLKCWGSWWKDRNYSYFVRKWYNVFSTDTEFEMEILSETEDKIDLRMNIFGERYIETYAESGVTKEEYIRFLGALLSSMAGYMGFEHELKIEHDRIYLTVIKK